MRGARQWRAVDNTMLVKNSVLVFAALLLSSAATFVFQVMMGNAMPLGDFGQLSAIIALQSLCAVPAGGLTMLYAKHAAALEAGGNPAALRPLYGRALRESSVAGFLLALAIAGTARWWGGAMDIPAGSVALLTALLAAVYYLQVPPLAFVRGLQRFWLFTFGLGGGGLVKIALAAVIIAAGANSVSNAVGALTVSVLFSVAVMHVAVVRRLSGLGAVPVAVPPGGGAFLASAIAGTLFPILYLNADMVLIRAVMPAEVSGHYGAFMVMGKMVFLCGQVVAIALFPAVVAGAAGGKTVEPLIAFRAFGLVLAVGLVLAAAAFFFPGPYMEMVLKESDPVIARLLVWYTLSAVAVALLFVESSYALARHRYGFLWAGGVAVAAQAGVIVRFSDSLERVVMLQAALFWGVFMVRAARLMAEMRAVPSHAEEVASDG